MNGLLTIVIIAFIIAQFTPRGQAFLASRQGALTTVVISAVAILALLPGLMFGNVFNLLFIAMWCYIAYPRLPVATQYLKDLMRGRR